MDIHEATRSYESWLGRHTSVVVRDVRLKHERMAESPFVFLRATFYRWIQVWPTVCASLLHAPTVLAVGDVHVENFGTWRDLEGRLIWGSTMSTKRARCPTPRTWCDWRPARFWRFSRTISRCPPAKRATRFWKATSGRTNTEAAPSSWRSGGGGC